jgi:hypothetical protein
LLYFEVQISTKNNNRIKGNLGPEVPTVTNNIEGSTVYTEGCVDIGMGTKGKWGFVVSLEKVWEIAIKVSLINRPLSIKISVCTQGAPCVVMKIFILELLFLGAFCH